MNSETGFISHQRSQTTPIPNTERGTGVKTLYLTRIKVKNILPYHSNCSVHLFYILVTDAQLHNGYKMLLGGKKMCPEFAEMCGIVSFVRMTLHQELATADIKNLLLLKQSPYKNIS